MTNLDQQRRELARDILDANVKHHSLDAEKHTAFMLEGWGPLPEPVELTPLLRRHVESLAKAWRSWDDCEPMQAVGIEAEADCAEAILNGTATLGRVESHTQGEQGVSTTSSSSALPNKPRVELTAVVRDSLLMRQEQMAKINASRFAPDIACIQRLLDEGESDGTS